MKLYVAGPMTGMKDFNYPAFERARSSLEGAGYEVLSPTDNGKDMPTQSWTWYMRRAVKMVADADGIAVLSGAGCSRGAVVEIALARALAIEVDSVDGWICATIDP